MANRCVIKAPTNLLRVLKIKHVLQLLNVSILTSTATRSLAVVQPRCVKANIKLNKVNKHLSFRQPHAVTTSDPTFRHTSAVCHRNKAISAPRRPLHASTSTLSQRSAANSLSTGQLVYRSSITIQNCRCAGNLNNWQSQEQCVNFCSSSACPAGEITYKVRGESEHRSTPSRSKTSSQWLGCRM